MAELILADQVFSFIKNTQDDIHCSQVNTLELTAGTTYTVIWDDEVYVCTAEDVELDGMNAVGMGNKSIEGIGADTGEPFLIGYSADYGLALLETLETDETHTVTIYEGVLEEIKGANIVLYDRNGQPVIYNGIETVSFNTDDGKIATYTHGTATDEVAVALDLSAGNQTVTPEGADLMKTVVIEKPANLVPSNIRKNEVVAGVKGELIGDAVTKEVELNLADGDQIVDADPDTLMSKIIIKKPESLRPENIAKDENVAGVVGTLKAGGGESIPPSDINFYDYDGTIVAAWTLEELAAATALPANPEHDGLISQGWNWTLADLQTTNRAMNVGQMYVTDDGKTRLYIRIATEGRTTVPLYFAQTVTNGVTIDWGDGSATETLSGTGYVNTSHTYARIGDYVISLVPNSGVLQLGAGQSNYCVLGSIDGSGRAYANMLRRVEVGSGKVTLYNYAFYSCKNLTSITLPNSVTKIYDGSFQYCTDLRHISIPNSVTSFGAQPFGFSRIESISIPNSVTSLVSRLFYSCASLKSVTIPDGVTDLPAYIFYSCSCLASITIPSSVTTIATYAINLCSAMKMVHLKPTTPPTVAAANAISGLPSDCIIYVPKGCLSAYQSATNLSAYASYMQEET